MLNIITRKIKIAGTCHCIPPEMAKARINSAKCWQRHGTTRTHCLLVETSEKKKNPGNQKLANAKLVPNKTTNKTNPVPVL